MSTGTDQSNVGRQDHRRGLIVGLGASAGGLEAFKRFFRAMPADSGMIFVLAQHLDPSQKSLVAELLNSQTNMPVVEGVDGVEIEPNHVYTIPPNTYMEVDHGRLRLTKPIDRHGRRMAVDELFISLSRSESYLPVGVIFSGTGSDGTSGLRAIRAAGGLTIAQEPRTAGHSGMPQSAIDSGVVDLVLAIEAMPKALRSFADNPFIRGTAELSSSEQGGDSLETITKLLKDREGFDLNCYKESTARRRILRRVGLSDLGSLTEYVDTDRDDNDERRELLRDLLINVTQFFRDPEAFQVLDREVIAEMIERLPPDESFRAWVAGCATGEEASRWESCCSKPAEPGMPPGRFKSSPLMSTKTPFESPDAACIP